MADIITEIPNKYVVFDLETTGFSPAYAEIIEIGAVTVENGIIVSRFQTYVKPLNRIPYNITALTGITEEMVKNAPGIEDAIVKFLDYIGQNILVAHNSSFDMRFVCAVCAFLGLEIRNSVIDSVRLAKKYIKGAQNYKLETLKNYLGIKLDSHNASDDCTVTYNVVEHCRKLMKEMQ
ncbi:MAG: 3'-5' exonuclease [Clostridia bacterium]|nr:3'-5' exonuclease [Clostridia bacterium]